MEGINGTVTISINEYERLRLIEKNIGKVMVTQSFSWAEKVSFFTKEEIIAKIIEEKEKEIRSLSKELEGKILYEIKQDYKKLFGRIYIKEERHERD